ncbi:rRNA maturation RNase YbeY [Paenisporosarcina quisquiliarum]|uniref:Endoribonuclease YbeY n=1 Tax=Paenisporosarcina quisquiliarum TaxID=365346 RepID=A0A9X3LDV1_9BACL|nr:rRNA maturation RNase YbeY [Paenisporosarcina quisquiliarum]MCZ8536068.1 rRNA maturation RNase YbeY [Paenisporosarcina quisquiliarum]
MHLTLDLIDQTESLSTENLEMIEKMLHHAAQSEGIEAGSELSVTFVNNEEIQQINHEYRGKNVPTDVISFAMEELGEGEMAIEVEGVPRMLGDIIISVERAKEQAADYGHSEERELGFLAIHGFLHLLGYDHMEADEEKEMTQKQEAILQSFGLRRE